MKARTYEIYVEKAHENVIVYPWSLSVLKKLSSKGYALAIASAADDIKVNKNIECIGVDSSVFNAIITGQDVEKKKPDPDIFLKAAEKAGFDPSECVVIEDAISGVKASKAANMTAVAVTTSFSCEELMSAGADYVTSDLSNLENLLSHIK